MLLKGTTAIKIWRGCQIYFPTLGSKFLFSSNKFGDLWDQKATVRDFPGGPVVKNPPYNAGDAGSIPGQGTKIPHAAGQLSPRATTAEPVCCKLQSPRALEPVRHNYSAHAPWSLHTTAREEKTRCHTREKPTRHNERSRMPQ